MDQNQTVSIDYWQEFGMTKWRIVIIAVFRSFLSRCGKKVLELLLWLAQLFSELVDVRKVESFMHLRNVMFG